MSETEYDRQPGYTGAISPEAGSSEIDKAHERMNEALNDLSAIERHVIEFENPSDVKTAVDETVGKFIDDCKNEGCVIAGDVGVTQVDRSDIHKSTVVALNNMPSEYLGGSLRVAELAGRDVEGITRKIDEVANSKYENGDEDEEQPAIEWREEDWGDWTGEAPEKDLADENKTPEISDEQRIKEEIGREFNSILNNIEADNPDDRQKIQNFRMLASSKEAVALDLFKSGYSEMSVIRSKDILFRGLDRIENEAQDPEQSKSLLLGLLECDGISLDQSYSNLIDEIIEEPARSTELVSRIKMAWQKSSEGVVPDKVRSEMLLSCFNRYGRINWQREESYDAYHHRKIDKLGEVFNMVDQDVIEACKLTGGDRDLYGVKGVIDSIVSQDVLPSPEELGLNAKRFLESFNESPQEVQKILSKGMVHRVSNANDLTIFSRSIEGVSQYVDDLKKIYKTHYQLEDVILTALSQSIDVQKTALYNDSEYIMSDDPIYSLRCATELYDIEPRFKNEIYQKIISMTGISAKQAMERLQDPAIIEVLDDESIRPELDMALPKITFMDKEVGSAIDAWREIDSSLPGLLEVIVSNEPNEENLKSAYYEYVRTFMSRKDKNGIPYDSADAIETFVRLESARLSEEGRANLEWFRSGDIPLSLLHTVIDTRDMLGEQASSLTPDEVYEKYRNDPELIEQLSHKSIREYLVGKLKINNARRLYDESKIEQAIELANNEAERRKDSFRLLVNIGPDALVKAAQDKNALASILDTDAKTEALQTRGTAYTLHRSVVELMAGVRSHGEEQHPIYGSVGFVDRGIPTGAEGYGGIMLTFRTDGLADRMSYTPQDSFHGAYRLTQEDAMALRILKSGAGLDHLTTSDYIEAQVRGGLSLEDVDKIYVNDTVTYEKLSVELPPELAAKLSLRETRYDKSEEMRVFREHTAGYQDNSSEIEEEVFADVPR